MSKRVIVFRHMEGDTPGRLAGLFAGAGYEVDFVDLHRGQAIPALDRYDLMLVLGGAMHAWEDDDYPWLVDEKRAIAEWVRARAKPYLGICLGHQLLANALGGAVGLSAAPEIGVFEVALDGSPAHPFLAGLEDRHRLMQWHLTEVSRPPEDAQVLARSADTAVQAMAVDTHALGVQFHCEWTLDAMRGWAGIDGWVPALEAHLGPGGHQRMLASAAPHMPAIDAMTERLYRNFARASGLEGQAPRRNERRMRSGRKAPVAKVRAK